MKPAEATSSTLAKVDPELLAKATAAWAAARRLAGLPTAIKNRGLLAMADALLEGSRSILAANGTDVEHARASGAEDSVLDRLLLDEERIRGIAEGVRKVAALPDPVGEVIDSRVVESGLEVARRRTPLGVVGIVFEAR